LLKHSDDSYSEIALYCDGSNQVTYELKACEIPLEKLMETPYSLQAGDKIVAKFAARNANGWGPLSLPTDNGAQIKTTPMAMAAPTRDAATTTYKLVVNWQGLEIPQNGYSTILSYNLEWTTGDDGEWTELIGYETDSLVQKYQILSGVNAGQHYKLRVRARNALGWGDFSPLLEIKAATWPETPAPVTTAIDTVSGGILLNWVAPYDNAETITSYTVQAYSKLTDSFEEICQDFVLECLVPMSEVRETLGY